MNPGGVARHVVDLANGLVEKGLTPIVAANDGPFRLRLRKDIAFVNLPLYVPNSGRKRLIGFFDSYKILLPIIRREQVVLIHSHKRYTDVLGRVLARRMALPHISTCHNIFASLKHISFFGDTTIACSKAVQEMLIRDFRKEPKAVTQINFGILPFREFHEDEKKRVLKELNIPSEKKIIASVGQLIESKDRATLVRAIGILKRKGAIDNVIFAILGDGGQKAMLEELVKNNDVQGHVVFLQGGFNVEALFNIADFMVLSSMQEGLPYVLMEAASIGKPHIATDVGGVSEFVIHGDTGILVPPSDPLKFADAIKDLLDNPETVERLGKKAREKFLQQFTYDRFIDQTVEVYKTHFTARSHAF
jgi:glycosyltransferase involved in cell wall biosynthesis